MEPEEKKNPSYIGQNSFGVAKEVTSKSINQEEFALGISWKP